MTEFAVAVLSIVVLLLVAKMTAGNEPPQRPPEVIQLPSQRKRLPPKRKSRR